MATRFVQLKGDPEKECGACGAPLNDDLEYDSTKAWTLNDIQIMARELYMRTAAHLLNNVDYEADCAFPLDDEYQTLSHHCYVAAKNYFDPCEGTKRLASSEIRSILDRMNAGNLTEGQAIELIQGVIG